MPTPSANLPPRRNRVSVARAIAMTGLAIFFDLLGVFLVFIEFLLNLISGVMGSIAENVIGIFIGWIGWLSFYVWFKLSDVDFAGSLKRGGTLIGTTFLETIPFPFLSALPFWTVGILTLIFVVRREDRQYNKDATQKAAAPRSV